MLEFLMENAFTVTAALFVIGILFFLFWKLFRSYPLIFIGLVATIGAGVMAMKDGNGRLGFLWILFALLTTIFSVLYWYKNIKGCFWWSLGALLAMPLAALPVEEMVKDENGARLVGILIPVGVFFVVGLVGSLVFPRLIHKRKEERKHLTNNDTLIGKRVTVTEDKHGENAARTVVGDVDWAVAPLYPNETFKVGDVVKVITIKGVTLLCTRDAKDEIKELKKKRKEQDAEAKAKAEQKRAEREARKAEKEKAKEEAKAKAEEEKKVEEVKEEPAPTPVEEPKAEEPAPVEEPKAEEPAPVEEPKAEEPAPAPVEEPVKKAKAEFIPFGVRLAQADPFVRDAYNELKAEVLSYGIKSRISSTGDTFRLHTKTYVKMVVAGKYLKLYLALNPEDYKDTTYPFEDASRMGAHTDAPFVFKIKSGLSVRRAKVLIGDAAKKDELTQGEVVAHNYASEVPNE